MAILVSTQITGTLSVTSNVVAPTITASTGLAIGPGTDNSAYFYISASSRGTANIIEIDRWDGTEVLVMNSTGSMILTGSLLGTSSWATNVVNGGGGTTLYTGSTYPITSSWSEKSISASLSTNAGGVYTATTNTSDNVPVMLGTFDDGGVYPGYVSLNKSSMSYQPSTNTLTVTTFVGTSSWAQSISSNVSPYTTIITSSTNWITCSFLDADEYLGITLGQLYNFTCSNLPDTGKTSDTTLFISNTSVNTSSLSFPTTWIFIGISPTYITASKNAVLNLKAWGGTIAASWNPQY